MKAKFREQLRYAGYSITQPREVVFEALAERSMLLSELRASLDGKLDRASLYRVLSLFEELDVAVIIGQGKQRRVELSDRYKPHHHHLNCLVCGRLQTIEAPTIERELAIIAKRYGFEASGHQLEISGVCRDCAASDS